MGAELSLFASVRGQDEQVSIVANRHGEAASGNAAARVLKTAQ